MSVDRAAWLEEARDQEAFLQSFGEKLPEGIRRQHAALITHLGG